MQTPKLFNIWCNYPPTKIKLYIKSLNNNPFEPGHRFKDIIGTTADAYVSNFVDNVM